MVGSGSPSQAAQLGSQTVTSGLVPNRREFESTTDPKFGEVLGKIQADMGAKPEKQREIKKTLGKDDFMRIMITQMKNQDPTEPFKAEQFASELAQYASVEQLQNLNQTMTKMATQSNPLERLAMTQMIGKSVTVDKERFPYSQGSNQSLSFQLPSDAKETKVTIYSEAGELVHEAELGELKAGSNAHTWDGKMPNTLPAKSGNYVFRVEAKDEQGRSITTNPRSTSRVIGVSFEGTEPVFLVGDPSKPDKITLKNIVKVDDVPGGAPLSPALAQAAPSTKPQSPVQAAPVAPSAPAAPNSNYFSFQKGQGSSTLNMDRMPPEVRKALDQYEVQAKEFRAEKERLEQEKAAENGESKGFPNGLSEGG